MKNTAVFGIDLGTTNSLLYRYQNDKPEIILIRNQELLPSAVRYDSSKIPTAVGYPARNARLIDPTSVITSVKRQMGKETSVTLKDGLQISPEEISAEILKALFLEADDTQIQQLLGGQEGPSVVITVPAHFSESARRATLKSAELAGLKVLRLINEPTAAALAFCHVESHNSLKSQQQTQEYFLVYDLGGGTFDVSIVERNEKHFEVLASEGNNFLGGDDFDLLLRDAFIDRLTVSSGKRDIAESAILMAKLSFLAEETKKKLSYETHARVYDEHAKEKFGIEIDFVFSRAEFEALIETKIMETAELAKKALVAANLNAEKLNRVLLVGGSSRIPLCQQVLRDVFPNALLDSRVNPDLAVAQGAAIQAAIIAGLDVGTVLVDVAQNSLGIASFDPAREEELMFHSFSKMLFKEEGLKINEDDMLMMTPILPKNIPLPAKASKIFSTMVPMQKSIEIKVAQGEKRSFFECEEIGRFMFELATPKEEPQQIEVALQYSVDGLVKVTVKEVPFGKEKEVIFKNSRSGDSSFELRDIEKVQNSSEETLVDNILLRKLEAKINENDISDTLKNELLALQNQYQALLKNLNNSSEIDIIEDKILDILEG